MTTYLEKLKDPRWQKKRLEILERDKWKCKHCGETEETLHIHHIIYIKNIEPWDTPCGYLITLCESCHKIDYIDNKESGMSDEIYCIGLFLDQLHANNIPIGKLQDWAYNISEGIKVEI